MCLSLWCVLLVTSTPKIVLGSLITCIYQSLLILWAKVDVSSSAPLSYMIDWEIILLSGMLHFHPVCVCQQTLEPVWTKLCGWVGNGPVKVPLNFTGNLVKGADLLLFFFLYVQDCFALAEVCTLWSAILVLHWVSFQLEAQDPRERQIELELGPILVMVMKEYSPWQSVPRVEGWSSNWCCGTPDWGYKV